MLRTSKAKARLKLSQGLSQHKPRVNPSLAKAYEKPSQVKT